MNSYRVWAPKDCIEKAKKYANRSFPLECGGMLFGYINQNEIVVRDVTGPGLQSKATKNRFFPDQESDLKEIEICYSESDGLNTYLGDWHSHPTGVSAQPSLLDKWTLSRIASRNEFWPVSIMMILAGGGDRWDERIFLAKKSATPIGHLLSNFRLESPSMMYY